MSGVGGSILNSKGKNLGSELRLWVQILLADFEFKKKLWSIYNNEIGYTEPLHDGIDIAVHQDDHGLYAIDILDPSLVGREKQSAFCLMQKLPNLNHLGTKLQITSACALDHVKGSIFIEPLKQNEIY